MSDEKKYGQSQESNSDKAAQEHYSDDKSGRALVFGGLCIFLFLGGAYFLGILCLAACAYYAVKTFEGAEDSWYEDMEKASGKAGGAFSRNMFYEEDSVIDEPGFYSPRWSMAGGSYYKRLHNDIFSNDTYAHFSDTNPGGEYSMMGADSTGCSFEISDSSLDSFSSDYCSGINPATGYHMIGCIDIMGNPYGTSHNSSLDSFSSDCCSGINPATGYSMVGSLDVMGNPYGMSDSSSLDSFSSGIHGDSFSCSSFGGLHSSSTDPFDSGFGGCGISRFDD